MNLPKITVSKNTSRPANLRPRLSGAQMYPFDQMLEKDAYIEVPKEYYFGGEPFNAERYDAKKHRERVNSAARGYALKQNTAASQKEDYNAETFVPLTFTVAIVNAEDPENVAIGVWRD